MPLIASSRGVLAGHDVRHAQGFPPVYPPVYKAYRKVHKASAAGRPVPLKETGDMRYWEADEMPKISIICSIRGTDTISATKFRSL